MHVYELVPQRGGSLVLSLSLSHRVHVSKPSIISTEHSSIELVRYLSHHQYRSIKFLHAVRQRFALLNTHLCTKVLFWSFLQVLIANAHEAAEYQEIAVDPGHEIKPDSKFTKDKSYLLVMSDSKVSLRSSPTYRFIVQGGDTPIHSLYEKEVTTQIYAKT